MSLPTFPQPMSGDLYIFPYNGSTYDPAVNLNCTKFDIDTSDVDTKYRYSRGKRDYGSSKQTIIVPKPMKLTADLDDRSSIVAAYMFRGSEEALSLSSGTVSDEAVTVYIDKFVPLANYPITAASVTVTHTTGSPTYVEGTDYYLDYDAGLIMAMGSTITDAQSVKVDYTHPAKTGRKITGGAISQFKAKVILAGQELGNTTKKGRFLALMVNLGPAGAYDLMSDSPQVAKLVGSFETLTGQAPFTLETW